jgi:archaellum biogenesis ATPase FlaH
MKVMETAESDGAILRAVLDSKPHRDIVLGSIEDPKHYFSSNESLAIYQAVLEIVNEGLEPDLEFVVQKCTNISMKQVEAIMAFKLIDIENIDAYLHDVKVKITNKDLSSSLISELHSTLTSDAVPVQEKSDILKELATEIEDRLKDSDLGAKTSVQFTDDYQEVLDDRLNNQTFWTFGDPRIDALMNYGAKPGHVTTLGGRPSNGKSLLTEHLQLGLAMAGVNTLKFNFEMKNNDDIDRMVSMIGKIPFENYTKNYKSISPEERDKVHALKEQIKNMTSLKMYDKRRLSLQEIKKVIKHEQIKQGKEYMVVFIDLFTKIADFKTAVTPLDYEVICNNAQEMAQEMGIHLVFILQMNRLTDNIRLKDARDISKVYPHLSGFKNSGAFEEVSDNALLVCKPSFYAAKYDWADDIDEHFRVDLAKQRGGSISGDAGAVIYRVYPGILTLLTPEAGYEPCMSPIPLGNPNISKVSLR